MGAQNSPARSLTSHEKAQTWARKDELSLGSIERARHSPRCQRRSPGSDTNMEVAKTAATGVPAPRRWEVGSPGRKLPPGSRPPLKICVQTGTWNHRPRRLRDKVSTYRIYTKVTLRAGFAPVPPRS